MSRDKFIISDRLVDKHIMEDARPVQNISKENILSRFKKAQRTPNFGSIYRSIHSFLVTSNRKNTLEELQRVSKNKSKDTKKIEVNSTDLKPNPVVVMNLMITRKKSEPYMVRNCEFSNEATFELDADVTEDIRTHSKKYYIKHLSNAQLKNAIKCHGFESMRPAGTCS